MTVDTTLKTTCPRDCYDACGIEVALRDGVIRHVRGDRDHPVSRGRLCAKCTSAYNGVFLDPSARLTRPLLRDGPKGAGRWRTASWDEALSTVASRLRAVADDPGAGPGAILNAHYTGTFALLGFGFPMRFMRTLGAREIDPDTICNKAGHVALDYLYGTSEDGFDPRTAGDAACILVWGANPSASAPHQHEQWLPEAPGATIVVDAVRTDTARKADLHLQPFPGSDAALAFSIAHVLWRDGLLDDRLLRDQCTGWDELEPLLADCTPAWGETVTGVPAGHIEQASRWYGPGPSLLWIGQGFQRQPRGGNAVRAVGQLAALSGNLGRRGAGLLYLNGTDSRGLDVADVTTGGLPDRSPPPISHMDAASWLEDPDRTRALVCWNINIAASNPDQARLRTALQREDLFTVAIDLFATDTAGLADVVLPAASFLECDDLVASYFNLSLSAQVAVTPPLGQSLPNTEIFRRLAGAMGMTEPALHESDRRLLDRLLAGTGTGLTFDELAQRGTVWISDEPRVQFADLAFPTPSGRVELASARAQADGHPRVAQPWFDTRPAEGRLRLLTPASPWALNASFANERRLDGRRGPARVALHPDDAAERGLGEGDRARVASATGELELTVALSADLPRGVALSPKGRWPAREPQGANVNVLNPGTRSDMGASSTVHGLEVTVTPA
ncbi:MAG TPA: molybdopterin-dependent oxidoreductase [Solirubrobacteraceae bacterium]|jgi:anaerobic selenocysteine-containing dehydrogenase|nr:molybdopterin-dependent oxidoreductase [Solirubrobacteraceae bacterium]